MADDTAGTDALEDAFLGVATSATGKRWADRLGPQAARAAQAMAQQLGLPDMAARVLAGRGVAAADAARWLNPTLKGEMPDPFTLQDMDKAAQRIADAIQSGESIGIVGDYDTDGATSSAIMARYLGFFGLKPKVMIPDRIIDGYGPNARMLEELAAAGVTLLVTVDCGTMSFEAFAAGRAAGLQIVVLDHHQASEALPETQALVNPNRLDDLSGLGYLCAAGVTFMATVAINRELRQRGAFAGAKEPDLMSLLDLVALGTVADVVPLTGLNRAFVFKGLSIMKGRGNRGLVALGEAAKISGPPQPYHLGFVYGPRINAGGRIGSAELGVLLLATDDDLLARKIALQLDSLNRERQAMESEALEAATAMAERLLEQGDPPLIVLASAEWHPGIAGLIASRLKDRFDRPAVAIALNGHGTGTGSARSISGVDIGAAVRAAVDAGLLLKGGGHSMAAGLTVEAAKLAEAEAFLAARLRAGVDKARMADALAIDGALTARGASLALAQLLDQAGPYGAGNPEPLFVFPSHRVAFADYVGQGGHLAVTIEAGDGARLRCMAFRAKDRPLGQFIMENRGRHLHFAASIGTEAYQGETRLRARLVDAADPAVSRHR